MSNVVCFIKVFRFFSLAKDNDDSNRAISSSSMARASLNCVAVSSNVDTAAACLMHSSSFFFSNSWTDARSSFATSVFLLDIKQ